MALSDDPESTSASVSFPAMYIHKRGKFSREVRAAVIVGWLAYLDSLCEYFLPPPGASFPLGLSRYCVRALVAWLSVGPRQGSPYGNGVVDNNGTVVVVLLVHDLTGLASLYFPPLLSLVAPQFHLPLLVLLGP